MRRPKHKRFKRFIRDIAEYTPITKMLILLVLLWLTFSTGIYYAEQGVQNSPITSFGEALYWGVAAFSTAGIADTPGSGIAQLIGGIWIVIGSVVFFGAIVATITSYFMRPMQRPHKKIIETIEYNLEQLDDLSVLELDLLKKTVDSLIVNMERIKKKQSTKQQD